VLIRCLGSPLDRETLGVFSSWRYVSLFPSPWHMASASNPKDGLSQLWSVGVEMHMYCLTPLLCEAVYSRSHGKRHSHAFLMLGFASALCVALRIYIIIMNGSDDTLYYTPFARMSPYISGLAVCLALDDWKDSQTAIPCTKGTRILNIFADLAAIATLLLSDGHKFVWGRHQLHSVYINGGMAGPAFGWALARCIFRVITADRGVGMWCALQPWVLVQTVFGAKAWGGIALLSYGAYVLQWFAHAGAGLRAVNAHLHLSYVESYGLWVSMCLLWALPCHFLVESPAIRLGRKVEAAMLNPAHKS